MIYIHALGKSTILPLINVINIFNLINNFTKKLETGILVQS